MNKNTLDTLQTGQTLLLVILAGVIALTVSIAVVTRTISNARSATAAINSQQALAAAEAGVQLSINQNNSTISTPTTLQGGTILNVTPIVVGGTHFLLQGGNPVSVDEGTDVWLIPHNASNTPDYTQTPISGGVTFYWGSTTDSSKNNLTYNNSCNGPDVTPALEFVIYYGSITGGTVTTATESRVAYDPCNSSGRTTSFTAPSSVNVTADGYTFKWSADIPSSSFTNAGLNAYLIKVIPLYHQGIIDISSDSGASIPTQGTLYKSTGASGDTQRTISYYRGFPITPPGLYLLYQK